MTEEQIKRQEHFKELCIGLFDYIDSTDAGPHEAIMALCAVLGGYVVEIGSPCVETLQGLMLEIRHALIAISRPDIANLN